jgi:ATP-dependent Clp protease ATP-binding subunit ClpA
MKYNPAEAAIAWFNEGYLTVRDAAGKQLYSIQCSEKEADTELTALKSTGLFQGCGTFRLAFNLQQTARIYYNHDQLHFESKAGQNYGNFTMKRDEGEKSIDAVAAASDVWMKVPGVLDCINANALSAVKLRGDALDFIGLDGKTYETSSPVSPAVAAPIVAKAKAAIDAVKSIKPVAAGDVAAKAAQASAKPGKEERLKLKELFNTLKEAVFGQDEPLEALAKAVKRARAGLQEENKPMGSFLFLGPTGVGKTEAARQLAKSLGYDFKKFDMSEYMDRVSASRMTGGSPNYVGYEEGGQLTNFVREHPRSVLLFDEIEKAHPEVANVLLQVLDDAQLTDGKGKTVFFKDTVIILTSNLGTGFTAQKSIGFTSHLRQEEPEEVRTSSEVKSFFLPEFMNRLTDVIRFKPLTPEIMLKMVDRFVAELTDRVQKQDTALTVTKAAREHLAKEGFSEEFGARPLKREMEKAADPLADEILFGELENGGKATIDAEKGEGGKMKLTYSFNKAAANEAEVANDNKNTLHLPAPRTSTALVPT